MKKMIQILLLLIVVGGSIAVYLYFKESTDYAKQKPDFTLSANNILQQIDTDTSGLTPMRNKLVLLTDATVKAVQLDSTMSVLEISSPTSSSLVIAQIDPRYNESVSSLQTGEKINIKGIFTNLNIDTDLGLGNTLQLNYCTLTSNQ
jgi:hypothetical protein